MVLLDLVLFIMWHHILHMGMGRDLDLIQLHILIILMVVMFLVLMDIKVYFGMLFSFLNN